MDDTVNLETRHEHVFSDEPSMEVRPEGTLYSLPDRVHGYRAAERCELLWFPLRLYDLSADVRSLT